MGIITETISKITCDFCYQPLESKPDKNIIIFFQKGYECDKEINIEIEAKQQWKPEQVVCNKCLIKYMKEWIKGQEDGE